MKNGHLKGGEGEREVAKLLQGWWRQLEPEVEFVRTPGSGGWQGHSQRGRVVRSTLKVSGDLATTAQQFPFCVEVKRREGFTMERFLQGGSGPVWEWWRQTQQQAREASLVPMLWFRQNRQPWAILLPLEYGASITLPIPVAVWSDRTFASLQYGVHKPAMWMGAEILNLNPRVFAL